MVSRLRAISSDARASSLRPLLIVESGLVGCSPGHEVGGLFGESELPCDLDRPTGQISCFVEATPEAATLAWAASIQASPESPGQGIRHPLHGRLVTLLIGDQVSTDVELVVGEALLQRLTVDLLGLCELIQAA